MRSLNALLTAVMIMPGLPLAAAELASQSAKDSAKQAGKEAERARKAAEEGPTIVTVGPLTYADRPTLSVMAFRYGTVTNQANYEAKVPKGSVRVPSSPIPRRWPMRTTRTSGRGLPSW